MRRAAEGLVRQAAYRFELVATLIIVAAIVLIGLAVFVAKQLVPRCEHCGEPIRSQDESGVGKPNRWVTGLPHGIPRTATYFYTCSSCGKRGILSGSGFHWW